MIQQSHSWVCSYVHSSTIHNTQDMKKQPQCLSADEWIKKIWYINIQWNNTQQKKKNEIMTFAATWMHLEIVILSEVSQTEKE